MMSLVGNRGRLYFETQNDEGMKKFEEFEEEVKVEVHLSEDL